MGNIWTTPTPPPPPPPPKPHLTADPWRWKNVQWTNEYHDEAISWMKDAFKEESLMTVANIVLIGTNGSGKSAFVNSIMSIGGQVVLFVAPSSADTDSCTTKFEAFTPKLAAFKNFRLFDTMGLFSWNGIHEDDIPLLLKGHIKRGYTFNSSKCIKQRSQYYNKNPSITDGMHCVVFCIPAIEVEQGLDIKILRLIANTQKAIKAKGLPAIVLVTNVSEVCEAVKKDITKIFCSVAVENVVEKAADIFKLAKAYIHPVENLCSVPEPDKITCIPLLFALRHALSFADDFVKKNPDCDTDSESSS